MTRFQSTQLCVHLSLQLLEARVLPSFLPPVSYSVPGSPWDIVVVDVNRDGKRDVAATVFNSVAVLLGNGSGALGPPKLFPTDYAPNGLQAADFNQDGIIDLVTTTRQQAAPHHTTVSVLLNNGDGTFQPYKVYPVGGTGNGELAAGDMNGDSKPDLAVLNYPGFLAYALHGIGDGSFHEPVTYSVGATPTGVAIGDLNGDMVGDLTVSNYDSDDVYVRLSDGSVAIYPLGVNPAALGHCLSDLNGDGSLDLFVGSQGATVRVLLNKGDGTFHTPVELAGGNGNISPVTADFNRDSILDIATGNHFTDSVSVLLGEGDGSLHPPSTFSAGGDVTAIAVGDLTSDRYPDLVVASINSIKLLVNDGIWTPPIPPPGPGQDTARERPAGQGNSQRIVPVPSIAPESDGYSGTPPDRFERTISSLRSPPLTKDWLDQLISLRALEK